MFFGNDDLPWLWPKPLLELMTSANAGDVSFFYCEGNHKYFS